MTRGGFFIRRESWNYVECTVGLGEKDFKMSRGSFTYKDKTRQHVRLKKTGSQTYADGLELLFSDGVLEEAYRLSVTESDGKVFVKFQMPKGAKWNRFSYTVPTNPKEHIYGCGETYSTLDLKGEKVRIWVAEHQNAGRIGKKMIREKLFGKKPEKVLPFSKYESYYVQPTFVSSDKYYVHVNTGSYAEFDFCRPECVTFHTEEPLDLIMEKANSFAELSGKLTKTLGRQQNLPDWLYDGVILAIQEGTEVIEEKIKKVEDAGGKVCGVWSQDWCGCRKTGFGYQVMWNWEWDSVLYKDLDRKIPEWKNRGIRFLGYINPFIALEKELYQTAKKEGYCVKDKNGEDYLVTITTFPAAMVDFTNPKAYEWYKSLIKENMIGMGMSGWMADFGEYLPVDAVLHSGEDPEKVHNEWPAIWAKLNAEAIEECGAKGEVFFFTRAGYTGTLTASPMMWTGDQHVDWSVDDGLPSVIPATLSLAMSGFGIAHSDVGGYTTVMHMKRSKELLLRWMEMNIFSPLLRTHEGNQPVNDVQFDADQETIEFTARCSKRHEALKPYLQLCVEENAKHGIPVMRPLFYHYEEEKAYVEKTEYLLGRDLLVAPVIKEGALSRSVYFPQDTWMDIYHGDIYEGGVYEVAAPIGMPPVFLRVGGDQEDLLKQILGL